MAATRRNLFAAASALPLAGMAMPPNPDAALIGACDEHRRLHGILNRQRDPRDCDEMPEWGPYMAACAVIEAARATTLAGIVAKASAAKAEAWQPNGQDHSEVAAEWAWAIVNDLLRLNGGVP
jgi:hypothetical protein